MIQQKITQNNLKTINGISIVGSGDITTTGLPDGSNTQIQFNNNGVFGASSNLTWNGNTLSLGNNSIIEQKTSLKNSGNLYHNFYGDPISGFPAIQHAVISSGSNSILSYLFSINSSPESRNFNGTTDRVWSATTTEYRVYKPFVVANNSFYFGADGNTVDPIGAYFNLNSNETKVGLFSVGTGSFGGGDLRLCVRTPQSNNQRVTQDDHKILINTFGLVGINATPLAQLDVINSSATQVGLKLTGASSQSSDIAQFVLNNGKVKTKITSNGNIYNKALSGVNEELINIDRSDSSAPFFRITTTSLTGTNGTVFISDQLGRFTLNSGIFTADGSIFNQFVIDRSQNGNSNYSPLKVVTHPINTKDLAEFFNLTTKVAGITNTGGLSLGKSSATAKIDILNNDATQPIAKFTGTGGATAQFTNTGGLVLPPGGTSAGTAPLKLTSQPAPLTTIEQGAFELVGNSLQFSQLLKRQGVAMSESVLLSDIVVSNSIVESSAIITAEHGAGYLEVGKCEEIVLRGTVQQTNTGSGQLQVRIKYAGVTLQTVTTVAGNIAAGTPFEIRVSSTCRSIGVSGTMQFNSVLWIDGVNNSPNSATLATIDTTTSQNTTVTLQWTVADTRNNITVNQGRVLCIEPNR